MELCLAQCVLVVKETEFLLRLLFFLLMLLFIINCKGVRGACAPGRPVIAGCRFSEECSNRNTPIGIMEEGLREDHELTMRKI